MCVCVRGRMHELTGTWSRHARGQSASPVAAQPRTPRTAGARTAGARTDPAAGSAVCERADGSASAAMRTRSACRTATVRRVLVRVAG